MPGANFRIVPCKTDGTAVLKVNNGTEHKLSKAMTAGEWNALALVYAENDTEGTVAVYLNGEEVLPATGIGFKLSEKSGIVGAVGATFGTGFMRTGLYDELVVTGAADAEAAKVETAARKAAGRCGCRGGRRCHRHRCGGRAGRPECQRLDL